MKSLKIFFLAALVALAGAFTACTEDGNWSAGDVEKGTRVYFSNENAASVKATADATSVAVTLGRNETVGALEVSVSATFGSNDYASFFTVPQTVIFNDGMETATINIGYDFSKLVGGQSYDITLSLVDETLHSNYGYAEQTITVVCPEPYVLLGTATMREDILTTFFSYSGTANPEWEVEAYEHLNYPGYIFLKNAYTSAFPANEPGDYVEEDVYFTIDARDPNNVQIPQQKMGHDWGYGAFVTQSIAPGTLKNGVITFPASGLVIAMLGYNDGGFYYSNLDGMFRVVLPGAVLTDYTMTVEYGGMQVAADNTTVSAVLKGTYGADVASMRYAFFDGDVTAAAASAADIIVNAAEEEVSVMEFKQGLEEADRVFSVVESNLVAPGVYTIFCVPYNAAGEPQVGETATVSFYYPGVGANEAPECELAGGLYYVSQLLPDYSASFPDSTCLLWLIEGTDIKEVVLAGCFTTASLDQVIAENVAEGMTEAEVIEALVGASGEALDESYLSEMATYGYTFDVATGLTPDTGWSMLAKGTNVYGSTKLIRLDGKTTAEGTTAAAVKGAGVLKPEFNRALSASFSVKVIK